MRTNNNQPVSPARAVPPGIILKRELDARGWTQKDLAQIIARPEQMISEIVQGSKQITAETALDLADAFGTSGALWSNLESNYRLFLAGKNRTENQISLRSRLYQLAPVRELIRRGWIPATLGARNSDVKDLQHEIFQFLGITSLEDTSWRIEASLRCSSDRGPDTAAQAAWLKRVERLAGKQPVLASDAETISKAIGQILALAGSHDDVVKVPSVMQSLGIRFVIVPHLARTYIDGAVLHSDGNPVIALTLRYDRIDAFWFTLMHELAHIVHGDRGVFLDCLFDDSAALSRQESAADRQARDWLLDPQEFKRFVSENEPRFTRAAIMEFAAQQNRHPGIVLGRLQREGLVRYGALRELLVGVREKLEPWIDKAVGGSGPA